MLEKERHMMRKKIAAIAVAALTVVSMLSGCGSSGQSGAQSGGTLTVGTDATFQPFEYQENGKYKGFDIDLMQAMAKKAGYEKVEWVNTAFKGLIPGLLSKKFDVAASAIYITPERQQQIDFTNTYYPGGLAIMVPAGNTTVKDRSDLAGKTVAVQTGTKSVEWLKQNEPQAKIVEVESNNEMFLQVASGKSDVAVTGKPAAKAYAKTNPKVKVIDKTLTTEEYGFGVRKEDSQLKEKLNKALKDVKADGEYDKIMAKYF
jgi:polar amino acid transport system substrate-binding protein